MNQTPAKFTTFDLGLSSALVTSGFDVSNWHRVTTQKVRFEFDHSSRLDKAVTKYWADKIEVPARTYFDNLKMLKSMIHST